MRVLGWLEAVGIVLVLAVGVSIIPHIENLLAQTFIVTCLVFGTVWVVFAFKYGLPVRLRAASRTATTNGMILFSATLTLLVIAIALVIHLQDPEIHEWWFVPCSVASCVAIGRMLHLYLMIRLRGSDMIQFDV